MNLSLLLLALAACASRLPAPAALPPDLAPLGPLPERKAPDPAMADLGRLLFFDPRLSGDGSIACADCHDPAKGWGDGLALSKGYPGTAGFRNTPSLINVAYSTFLCWDGRLDGADLETEARDALTEGHFMAMDGRLMLERLKQVPEYQARFKTAAGGEPSFGRTLKALAAFEQTLVSKNVPFDQGALGPDEQAGRALFEGRAGCVACHNGPLLTDMRPHALGVPENPDVTADPVRHLTLRAYAKWLGVDGFERLRADPGYYVVTKDPADRGRFRTPPLRELRHTAPYMHNGVYATLGEVVDFYDRGGGEAPNKDAALRPLRLKPREKEQIVAFLLSLSGDPLPVERPELPPYQVVAAWESTEN